MSKIQDFNIFKEKEIRVIQIIDNFFEFNEREWLLMKTFMFDFLTESMKKHTEQGYLHSNDIDNILEKYK